MPEKSKAKEQTSKGITIRFTESQHKRIKAAVDAQDKTLPDGMSTQRFAVRSIMDAAEKALNPDPAK